MAGLIIEGLRKEFQSGNTPVVAVDDLTLTIEDGELLVLLGSSGCGKTTTLRLVAGLEQGTRGRISIGDRVVYDAARRIDMSPNRRNIGMVFQSYALWPHMTVRRNIAYPLRARRIREGLSDGWVEQAASLVDCTGLLDRYPSQLSGGQQQRIAVARALVARPTLLLFDEPLSNLDARLRDQLRHEIHQLHRRVGFTGLYVTHDQAEALAIGDRLAIMRDGRIEQLGTPREVFERPATEYVASFIGVGNRIDLHTEAGRWASSSGQLVGDVPALAGENATVRVRPEAVRLGSVESMCRGEMGVSGATIVDATYAGTHLDAIARFGDGRTIHARVPLATDSSYDVGSDVTVIVNTSKALFFAADGSPLPAEPVKAFVTTSSQAVS
ncbi:MAG: ABC transporter ATP-binding protein [Acidimicrobiia bacterium]